MPLVSDARAYGSEWVKWWTAAQPKERNVQEWPFIRNAETTIDWRRFPANGKDGMFIAIMALSWWALALRSSVEVELFEEAVTDVLWVVQELIRIKTVQQLSPSNPPLPQGEPNPPSLPQPSPSRPPVSDSNVPIRQRGSGERVVKPTWKVKDIL